MTKWLLTAVFLASTALAGAGSASAGGLAEAAEVEAARANARAGGTVSDRDAELLQRYGCSSGTNNPICNGGNAREYRIHHRRKRMKSNNE